MAFDQPTRNRLAAFVGDARAILTLEFTQQLQADYGLNPERGEVMALDSMQLDNARRATAELLRETLDYYLANAHSQGAKARKEALERIVREQAFTVLNRLCALRMAEARGLLIESIGSGYQSKGFKLYGYMTGSALGETGDAYRAYLFSLCDELAVDLRVLFDRFSPEGRLFPGEKALLELFGAINHPDLAPLWAEDETIGWIYQYFNSQEERRKMRAESQAPRNSRELAVRNQFFTPRYVVEFLTDNTLGRTWYEMTLGETQLADRCRYLVRRPQEIFLCTLDVNFSRFAPWVRVAAQANFADLPAVPELNEIGQFALLIDGYRSESAEPEDDPVAKASRQMQAFVEQEVPFPADTLVLWQILFVYQRAMIRHGMPDDPADPFVRGIRTAYTSLRDLLQNPPTDLPQEELLRQPVFIPRRPCKDPRTILLLDPACGSMHFGLYAFDLFEAIYSEAWDLEEAHGPDALLRTDHLGPLLDTYPDKAAFLRDVPRLIVEHNIHGIDIDRRAVQIAELSLWLRAQRSWHSQGVKPAGRPIIQHSNVVCAEPMPGDKATLQEFVVTLEPKLLGNLVATVFEKMELAGEAGSLLKIEEEIRSAVSATQERYYDHLLQQQKEAGYLPGLAPDRDTTLFDLMELPEPNQFWAVAEELVVRALREYAATTTNGNSYTRRLFAHDAVQGLAFVDVCRKQYDVVLMNPPFGSAPDRVLRLLRQKMPATYVELYACFLSRGLEMARDDGRVGAISSRAFLYLSRLATFRHESLSSHIDLLLDLASNVMDDAFVEACAYTVSPSRTFGDLLAFDARKCTKRDTLSEVVRTCLPLHEVIIYDVPWSRLSTLPSGKFLYYVSRDITRLLTFENVFEPNIGTARGGACTFDDFRFVHLLWEVPPSSLGQGKIWEPLAKGGPYAKFYGAIHLAVNWSKGGGELCEINFQRNGQTAQARQASDYWRRGGITYTKRSAKGFSARALPRGCIISTEGPAVMSQSTITERYLLGWLNSRLITGLIELQANASKFNTGIIKNLPWIPPNEDENKSVAELAYKTLLQERSLCRWDETDQLFLFSPSSAGSLADQVESILKEQLDLLAKIDTNSASITHIVDTLYGVDSSPFERSLIDDAESDSEHEDMTPLVSDISQEYCRLIVSVAVGMGMGRWDIRHAIEGYQTLALPDPFDFLPVCQPGMLQNSAGLPAARTDIPDDYPLNIAWPGILVDDPGHLEDIESRIRNALQVIWGESAEAIEREMCTQLGVRTLRGYVSNPNGFFDDHLSRYSKSRRQAPIYWPLSTASNSYTLWLYYHRLTDQKLYQCVNDFVDPKRKQLAEQLAMVQRKPNRNRDDERAMEQLATLDRELADFRAELLRVAAFWKPNLNDGVQITAAPLYRLINHRAWRARLQETWEKLETGEYDWAHLAYDIWPERVRAKCQSDRSLAIAHDLEQLYVELPSPVNDKRSRRKPAPDVDTAKVAAQAPLELGDVD